MGNDRPTRAGWARRAAVAPLAAAPPVWTAATVARYAVDVPFWDQWELVPLLDGGPTLEQVVAPHNEHRIVVPRLIMLALAGATAWDTRFELAVGFLFALLGYLVLLRAARRVALPLAPGWLPVAPAVALLAFSLAAWENWLWGWQLQIFGCVAAASGALTLLAGERLDRRRLVGAAALALIATYSFGVGALVWPIGLGVLLLRADPERRRRAGAWACAAALALAPLALDPVPPHHPAGTDLATIAAYVLAYLGAPLAPTSPPGAAVAGGLGLVAFVAVTAALLRSGRLRREDLLGPCALAAFAVGSALVTAVARAGLGVWQATSSRYITISSLLWIGLVVLVDALGRPRRGEREPPVAPAVRVAAGVLIAAVLALSFAASLEGRVWARQRSAAMRAARDAMREGRADDAVLQPICPDPAIVRERLRVLEARRLSLFRGAAGDGGPR